MRLLVGLSVFRTYNLVKVGFFKKREWLNVGTVHTFRMHKVGTVPMFKIHNKGAVPKSKMVIGTVLAFIGEKFRGILSSRGIFHSLQSQENFSPFHLISWDLSSPHPFHEKFSPSRGIHRLKLLMDIIFKVYFEEIKFPLRSLSFSK